MALAEFPFSLWMDRLREETADNNGAGNVSEEPVGGDEKVKDPGQLWTLSSFFQMVTLNTWEDEKVPTEKFCFVGVLIVKV